MAFNPFESFRKNGKIIFAILTIVCMLTFVLSSGLSQGADFFDWLPKLIGGKSQRGDKIVELYGTTQHSGDLDLRQSQRALANSYMLEADAVARESIVVRVGNALKNKEVSEDVARDVQKGLDFYSKLQFDPELAQYGSQQRAQFLGFQIQQLRTAQNAIDKTKRARDHEVMSATIDALSLLRKAFARTSPSMYFQTVDSSTKEGLANFELFLQRANKMGIVTTPAVVRKAISDEFDNSLTEKDRVEIENRLRKRFPGFTGDSLLESLGNEFRIRTVRQATFGFDGRSELVGTGTFPPLYMTPFEFNQYYKDSQTRFNLAMIEVPIDQFVGKVTQVPTAEELVALFARYNKVDDNPASETPGFRSPRKVRLEWLSPSTNVALYAKTLPIVDAVSRIASGFSSTSAGTGVPIVAVVQAIAPTAAKELAWTSVQTIAYRQQDQVDPPAWSSIFEFAAKKDTTQSPPAPIGVATREAVDYDPAAVTSLVGYLVGGPSPLRDLSAQGAYRHAVETIEVRDRVRAGIPRLLGLASPYAGSLTTIAPSVAAMPKPLPLEFFKRESAKEIRNIAANNIVAKDMEAFAKKVAELSKEKDGAAAAKKYVDEFLIARPELKHGAMKSPRDVYAIGDDEALKLMKDTQNTLAGDPSPWNVFFDMNSQGQVMNVRAPKASSLFQPMWFPNGMTPSSFDTEKPLFLTWRTEDIAAKQYATYSTASQEVKDKVMYAWKFEKARELAKAEADSLEASIKAAASKLTSPDDFRIRLVPQVRDIAGNQFRTVEPPSISPLSVSASGDPRQQSAAWRAFEFKPTDILYAGPEMTERVLNLRKEKLGSTAVVTDGPRKNFYVATIATKVEPGMPQFMRVYSNSATDAPTRDTMYGENALGEMQRISVRETQSRVRDAAGFKLDEEALRREFEDQQARE